MAAMRKKLTSSRIIVLGFAGVILLGTLLLMLPISTREPGNASFADALFTSTSAVCVTGLVVRDTATYWSGFGQTVILIMIQVGGLGIVTAAVTISLALGRQIHLKQRSTMQEAISAPKVGGIVRLTGFILKTTAIAELTGAAVMAPVFCRRYGLARGLWCSLFHAVSAFCNAGFDLMGVERQYGSLTSFAQDPLINITVMMLIVFGGIGFLTWEDVATHRLRLRHYRMQSKVILTTTALLIIIPAAFLYLFEFKDMTPTERILPALFQSVTPRTAGFNTANLARITQSGQLLLIILMLIGGSPGSTAGGMKTTTIAVLITTAFSVFRHKEDTDMFGRRVAPETIRNAVTILILYVSMFAAGGLAISRVEQIPLMPCLFEAASAVGTVGLTLGITPDLGLISRMILILLMFCGRIGGMTLIFAAQAGTQNRAARMPQEKLTVG